MINTALRRSFDVYYRDAERTARMDKLNAQFVHSDDLVFDIGAHVGDRTASFRRLGAKVVALEPQPRVFRALRLLYAGDTSVVLRRAAVGAFCGTLDLHVNSRNPTVSTLSKDLQMAAKRSAEWQNQIWDTSVEVDVTTLDQLIADHGRPSFIKIDVEGYEAEALKGLTASVPALSFEFTTLQRKVALTCLDQLCELDQWKFNVSLGEDHALRFDDWITRPAMAQYIMSLPASANSGDVYARLV